MDPGMCPECGTVTSNPARLSTTSIDQRRRRRNAKWERRAKRAAVFPLRLALLLSLLLSLFNLLAFGIFDHRAGEAVLGSCILVYVCVFIVSAFMLTLWTVTLGPDRHYAGGLTTVFFLARLLDLGAGFLMIGLAVLIAFAVLVFVIF